MLTVQNILLKQSTLPIIPRYDEFGIPLFKQYPSRNLQNDWIAKYYTPYYDAIFEQNNFKENKIIQSFVY